MKGFKRYEWYKDSGVEWIGRYRCIGSKSNEVFMQVNPSKSDLKVPRNTKVTFYQWRI